MPRVLELLRSLGPSGAVANARILLDERRREDRMVRALAHHVAPVAGPSRRAA